ncbi:enoyl-CoA hydratase [Streptococcus sp. VTCC 12905]|jgi:trans-2-decenoyl-[acyl-carrier protein] isomerase|uniref:enoyl-CoA hydratase n=1 Tax=Streptococcus TaxID=1301 RepID=UPI001B59A471|nr:enoyl-CoA hydratase [Streptococcus parasuis]MBP6171105.1 enoyl-CoA hydratase [Streptococcus sp.]MDG3181251.1 enoyl-CoA hydratase [Streptococcus suis]MBP7912360.1 enoyl-CoA hydratase [Streptococcus sp.]MBP9622924.1 enoyl-CoA hydratase [Streptococcus sp.]MCA9760243.1 enoyl-CoA hydratase [Streptococcus sp.]
MAYQTIRYEVIDSIAILTLDRPDVSNGFNIPMCEEILNAIQLAENDETVKILQIQAEGSVFSVGGDLVEMKRAVDEDDIGSLVKIAELVNDISFALKKIPKIVLMVTDGAVAGAAANMAVAADFVIASSKTKFIQAFVGVGLAPDAGGIFLLSRAIGSNRASQLAITGEGLSADKALEYGIVYKLAEPEKLEKIVAQVLKKLLRGSVNSYAAIKQLVWESQFKDWESYRQLELAMQESLAYKEDFKEGVRAHTERRRPIFIGK